LLARFRSWCTLRDPVALDHDELRMSPKRLLTVLLAAAVVAGGPASLGAVPPPVQKRQMEQTGHALYVAACASCHGPDGRGAQEAAVAFADPLPDLTDCRFATREPDLDWTAIIHDGGPARGFGRMMPAFGDALTPGQVERVLAHVRTLCSDRSWPRGELNLPRPLVTEKAFPEDEVVLSTGMAAEGEGELVSRLVYERRLGARSQVEVAVPFGFADQSGSAGWVSGVGDLAVGFKRALFHSLERGSILSVTGEVVLPTGNDAKGFSKGTTVFEPFVTFGQILGGEGFLQAQAGIELPADQDRALAEAFWRVALGRSFSEKRWGRTWSPMVEVLGARELAAGEAVHWDVVPQVQVTLSRRQHVLASLGVRIPLNDTRARPTQVVFYVLWDWFDGPLFGGW
jgi:mono/diheme cytochrome c family protein